MKIIIDLEIEPFGVPDYVKVKLKPGLKQDGLMSSNTNQLDLSELDSHVLERLCDNFKNDVFKRANKIFRQG